MSAYPDRMTSLRQWVVAGLDKIPLNPRTLKRADTTNPKTWTTYATAAPVAAREGLSLGFVITKKSQIVGVDLDHCRNAETGEIADWALTIVEDFFTYTEISISGTGLHLFAFGELPEDGRKRGNIELYDEGRFFVMTGHWLPQSFPNVGERPQQLAALHRATFTKPERPKKPVQPITRSSEAILTTVRKLPKGRQLHDDGNWKGLNYSSQSEADVALCNCYVAAGADRGQADDLFRRSGLMRDKWDVRHHGDGRTYGEGTLDKAFDGSVQLLDIAKPIDSPPSQDDYPPETIGDVACPVALAQALRDLAALTAELDHLQAENVKLREQVEQWSDRWTREQKVRETPTVQAEADLINAAGWIWDSTMTQPETYEKPDGTRAFRRTKDGYVRVYRTELAKKTGKSERTITTQLATARKLNLIDVRHEPERIIDAETGEIQTIPDSTVIFFRPAGGSVAEMHHRATLVTPEQRMAATGKEHTHGGKRLPCPVCGCDRRKTVCADCGFVWSEEPPGHVVHRVSDTPPLAKTADNSKGATRTVVTLPPLVILSTPPGSPDVKEPDWLRDAPEASVAREWLRPKPPPGFLESEPGLDRWTS